MLGHFKKVMNTENKAYLQLHLAVFLFGFTAILGDLIQLSATRIVWWRVMLTSISLLFLINVRHLFQVLSVKTILLFMGIGGIVGLHWITFYGAIKLSNASVTLVCFATTSLFTALIEPIVFKQPIKISELGLGALVIPGMALIVNNLDGGLLIGILVGLFSAFLAALFSTLNKKYIQKTGEMNITFIELTSAFLLISLALPVLHWTQIDQSPIIPPTLLDWGYLLILSLVCTTFAYVLALKALKYISAFATNLTYNMEPIYGILLAGLILQEHKELTPRFYLGVIIILSAVFAYPILRKRLKF